MTQGNTTNVCARVPNAIYEGLVILARDRGMTKSDLIRDILSQYVQNTPSKKQELIDVFNRAMPPEPD